MHYEYTIIAIFSLFIGLSVTAFAICFAVIGIPTNYSFNNIYFQMIFETLKYGLLIGPFLIGLGAVGIYREWWVRSLERKARG